MRKNYYLLLTTLLVSAFSFGQDMVITGAFDGPLSGGTPKLVEIYVINDIADLSLYGFGSANNGGGTDGQELTFAGSATAGQFIYVGSEGSNPGSVNAYFGITADYLDSAANVNGDDALELFFNGGVIDTFGDINTDGTGQPWEYLDGWAYRVNNTGPDGASYTAASWTFSGTNVNDGQTSNATAPTPFPIGTYTRSASMDPTLTITAPSNAFEFTPGTSNVDVTFVTQNFDLTGGNFVEYSVNSGAAQTTTMNTISVATADGMSYTVDLELKDGGGSLTPAVTASVSFSVAAVTSVSDIAAIRTDVINNGTGGYYTLTGEAIVTYARASRNQKYIQDATAAILIDDAAGTITTVFAEGDGMVGLTGQTSTFNGVLQFVPSADVAVNSTGNTITPEVVTLAQITANQEAYESELVRVNAATFTDGDGVATFAASSNYDLTDASTRATLTFRTNFSEADYIGQLIPQGANGVQALVGEFNGTAQITSRALAELTLSNQDFAIEGLNMYPNPVPRDQFITIHTANGLEIEATVYDLLGKQVMNMVVTDNQLPVNSLKTGVYILRLSENGRTATRKLVIE